MIRTPWSLGNIKWFGRKIYISFPHLEFCGRVGKEKPKTERKNCKLGE